MAYTLSWDVETHYEEGGQGNPLFLIHPTTVDLRFWTPQAKVFSRFARTIAYDRRGHGRSSLPSQGYTAENEILQLRTLLDVLRITRPTLVGLCSGAAVAVHFALTHKTRVPALVLANPKIWGAPIPEGSFFHGKKYPVAEPGALDDPRLCKEALRRFLDGDLFAATRKNEKAFHMLESVVLSHSCAPFQEEHMSEPPDDFARLEEIQAPTLILSGELDDPLFRQCAEAAAARIPGARLEILPGVGHVSSLEAAPEFNRKVLDFLASLGLMEAAPPGAEQPPKQRPKRKSRERERRPGGEGYRPREDAARQPRREEPRREEPRREEPRREEPRREEARPRGRDERGRGERRREDRRPRGGDERERGERGRDGRGRGERSDQRRGGERPRDGEERKRGDRGRRRRRPDRAERQDRQEREERPARQERAGGGRGRDRSREDQRSGRDQRGRDRSSRDRGRQRRDREARAGGQEPRQGPARPEKKPRSDGTLGKIRRFLFGRKKKEEE